MIIIDKDRPECCDQCWALDDSGDYPTCRISGTSRGYNFNIRAKRMDDCPMDDTTLISIYYDALQTAITKLITGINKENKNERHC